MRELVGKLDILDPGSSNSLKVIEYFDALVDGHASPQTLLRGAAFISGVTAGIDSGRSHFTIDARGNLGAAGNAAGWLTHDLPGGGVVWIERQGDKHSNDDMILERLAIGMAIALERTTQPESSRIAVDAVIDSNEPVEARRAAALRLRLAPEALYTVVAEPANGSRRQASSTMVATRAGLIRATVMLSMDVTEAQRAGVGIAVTSQALDRSWKSAFTALRLTHDSRPVIRAADLGTFILIADVADDLIVQTEDSVALAALLKHAGPTLSHLESLVSEESLRASAASVGVHHSTLQAEVRRISNALGFDVRSSEGRLRLALALKLHRLSSARFD